MTALDALSAIDQATQAARGAVAAARQKPGGEQAAANLVRNLAKLEHDFAQEMSRGANMPLPAARADNPGIWTDAVRRYPRFMGVAHGVAIPSYLESNLAKMRTDCQNLAAWAAQGPEASGFGGMGSAAAGAAAAAGGPPVKLVGGILFGLSTLGTIASTWIAWRDEQKAKKGPFDKDDGGDGPKKRKHDPGEVQEAAQAILDQDVPGSWVSVKQAPDGEWAATVKRGSKVIVRRRGKSVTDAAGEAVRAAVDTTIKAEGEIVDAEFVELAPKKEPVPAKQDAGQAPAAGGV